MSSLKKKALTRKRTDKQEKDQVAALEKQCAELQRRLDECRQAKFTLPGGKPRKGGRGKTWLRLIIPDSHGSVIDPDACRAFLADLDQLDPAEVVWLGDHMDCGGHLDEKHTLGYVSQTDYTVAEDEDAANLFIDEVQKRTPNAKHYMIQGNHEWRMEREAVRMCKNNGTDIGRWLERNGHDAVLGLSKRGIKLFSRDGFHMGLSVNGAIKLGKCMFTHGQRAPVHAAAVYAQRYGTNIVFGHTHRPDSHYVRTASVTQYVAFNHGCLCRIQPVWMNTNITNWGHGYGLQVVQSAGDFFPVHVPIIDGRSWLKLLAGKLGAA